MTFDEMVAGVVSLTGRPDKTVDIGRLINKAINFCCVEGNFARDVEEQAITVPVSSLLHSIPVADLTRFRKVAYMRPVNSNKLIQFAQVQDLFVNNKQRCDVYYVAGADIKVHVGTATTQLLVGYFQYPPILSGSNKFWLTDVSPYMIIDHAASSLFASVGEKEEAGRLFQLFSVAYDSARKDLRYGSDFG